MKRLNAVKKISLVLSALLIAASLSGCQYSSVDEYLELLGMKCPSDQETSQQPVFDESVLSGETTDPEFEVTEDEAISPYVGEGGENQQSGESGEISSSDIHDDKVFEPSYHQFTESELNDEMNAARSAIGLTADNISNLKEQQKGKFAFERLTEAGKTLYVEMLAIIENHAENVLISTTNEEAMDLVFDYVTIDHPELFYIDGYRYTNYTIGNEIARIGFSGNYLYSEDEIKDRQLRINEAVNECLSGAPSSTDEYYVIKYVYEYIINTTEYDLNAEDNQNICSVFLNGRSVCNGYAKAAQYLLNRLGIECSLVIGTVNTKKLNNAVHAWNIVRCNGAYYYFDVTWGDSSYQSGNGENAGNIRIPEVNYDYLNVTSAEIGRNHTVSDLIKLPECNSMKDNYYVREDEYFTSAELSLVGDLFDRRYDDGSENVVIKCADSSIYDALYEELITNRKVFSYLKVPTSTIIYTTYAETNTIIFWI